MSVIFYTVNIMYICVFIMRPTSYCLCDKLMDPWNVYIQSIYIYIYIYIYNTQTYIYMYLFIIYIGIYIFIYLFLL